MKIQLDRQTDSRWSVSVRRVRGAHVYRRPMAEGVRRARALRRWGQSQCRGGGP
jgi:hypothetical protein